MSLTREPQDETLVRVAKAVAGNHPKLLRSLLREPPRSALKKKVPACHLPVVSWRAGMTLLHAARSPTFVQTLTSLGVPVNARDNTGATPLLLACGRPDGALVRALLDAGADPNIADNSGHCPLHAAAAQAQDLVQALLDAGADPTAKDAAGATALWAAVHAQNMPAVQTLLTKHPNLNIPNNTGRYILRETVFAPALTDVLLAAGADVTLALSAPSTDGISALSEAAHWLDSDVLALMLRAGIKPDTRVDDRTLLWVAVYRRSLPKTKMLLEAGANPNLKATGTQETPHRYPLEVAVARYLNHEMSYRDQLPIIRVLVAHGADLEPSSSGAYSLRQAVNDAKEQGQARARRWLNDLLTETARERVAARVSVLTASGATAPTRTRRSAGL